MPQEGQGQVRVNGGKLLIKPLRNTSGEIVKLKNEDRFFYNQEFYLQ